METIMLLMFAILLGWIILVGFVFIANDTKPKHKKLPRPTCPSPKKTATTEEQLLCKIRVIKTLTNNGYYCKALSLLEEVDVIISNLKTTNNNPVNSGELKE